MNHSSLKCGPSRILLMGVTLGGALSCGGRAVDSPLVDGANELVLSGSDSALGEKEPDEPLDSEEKMEAAAVGQGPVWCTGSTCSCDDELPGLAVGPWLQQGPALPPTLLGKCWAQLKEEPEQLQSKWASVDSENWVRVFPQAAWYNMTRRGLAAATSGDAYLIYNPTFKSDGETLSSPSFVHRLALSGEIESTHMLPAPSLATAVMALSGGFLVAGKMDLKRSECAAPLRELGAEGVGPEAFTGFLSRFSDQGEELWTYSLGLEIYDLAPGPEGSLYIAGINQGAIDLGTGEEPTAGGHTLLQVEMDGAAFRSSWALHRDGNQDGPRLTEAPDSGVVMTGWTEPYVAAVSSWGDSVWSTRVCAQGVSRAGVLASGQVLVHIAERTGPPSEWRDWLSAFAAEGEQLFHSEIFGKNQGIYRVWGSLPREEDWLVLANSGYVGTTAGEENSELLRVAPDGSNDVVERFPLREVYASPPVWDAEGGMLTAGKFSGVSTFGLDIEEVGVPPGSVGLYLRRRGGVLLSK